MLSLFPSELCNNVDIQQVVSAAAEVSPDWNLTYPLQEDLHLQRFTPLEDGQKNLDFTSNHNLTQRQEVREIVGW